MLEPRAIVGTNGDTFKLLKQLPPNTYLHTLPDLLAALREPSEQMIAEVYTYTNFSVSEIDGVWQAMLSAFERQMEGEK